MLPHADEPIRAQKSVFLFGNGAEMPLHTPPSYLHLAQPPAVAIPKADSRADAVQLLSLAQVTRGRLTWCSRVYSPEGHAKKQVKQCTEGFVSEENTKTTYSYIDGSRLCHSLCPIMSEQVTSQQQPSPKQK